MQISKYIQKQYPATINGMSATPTLSELNKGFESEVMLRDEIMRIAATYLSMNIKGRSINNDEALTLVIDFILEDCSNLELQEINFIFKSGVMGRFGVIYNDISIDTICGKDGWIEMYYKDFRKQRKDPEQNNSDFKLSGKEMTLNEFHQNNPKFKERYDLHSIFDRAKNFKNTIDDAKQFYKIKGLSDNDFKDDMEFFAKLYNLSSKNISEIKYINECFRKFIIKNIYKTKG